MTSADLLPGTLDMLILQTLSHGPQHGYDIARFIRQHSEEALRVIDGALYASLHRLERRLLITAHWGRSRTGKRAKFYELTSEGWTAVQTEAGLWHRYITAVSRVLSVPRRLS